MKNVIPLILLWAIVPWCTWTGPWRVIETSGWFKVQLKGGIGVSYSSLETRLKQKTHCTWDALSPYSSRQWSISLCPYRWMCFCEKMFSFCAALLPPSTSSVHSWEFLPTVVWIRRLTAWSHDHNRCLLSVQMSSAGNTVDLWGLCSIRSICHKSLFLNKLLINKDLDLLFLMEMCQKAEDFYRLKELCPPGCDVIRTRQQQICFFRADTDISSQEGR